MKTFITFFVLGLVLVFVYVGCAKQPTQAINDAKAAIEAVSEEGADKYAPEELKKLIDDLTAALDEVKTQDEKFFKNYDKANEMLAKVKADAEVVKASIPARKEEAKNNALTAQNEAKAAVEEAKALLERAPRGKGTRADIEAFKADLKALEDALLEIQQAIDGEDYFGAADKANTIKGKAVGISEQIKQAIEKVGKR